MREDVSIADDISSWTNTSFAAAGTGANPNGKNWVGKDSTAIAGVNVDIGKSGNPLNLWGMELGWTVIELQAAQQVGRPIDTQKYDGMQLKWQMDNDEQVYVGDSALNLKGLVTPTACLSTTLLKRGQPQHRTKSAQALTRCCLMRGPLPVTLWFRVIC